MVEWICIVPGCKSNSKAPGHFFPKNPKLSQKWKEIVNNSILLNLSSEELTKYRVCHLHFLPEDYIYSLNRRRLKHNSVPRVNISYMHTVNIESGQNTTEQHSHNAVPIENIYNTQTVNTEVNDINITEQHLQPETNTIELHLQLEPNITEQHSQSEISTAELHLQTGSTTTELHSQSQESNQSNEIFTSNFLCAEKNPLQNDQNNITNNTVNCPSTSRNSRNILESVTRQCHLTPKAQKIYKKAIMLAKERNRMKSRIIDYKTRLKDAKKLLNSPFCKQFNSLTPTQRLFFNMQLRNTNYSPKGRRFTIDEKILALSLYKQSGSCYKLLSKLFVLPSATTLKCLLRTISLQPGINKFIFEHLQQHVAEMNERDKLCILMWDEMSLEANLQYDQLDDKIIGFEDWGHRRTSLIADHVLVFMARGVLKGWKIPLCYNFCKSQTKSAQLLRCIKEIIKKLTQAGLTIITTVCDQGGPNMTCINKLLEESRRKCIQTGQEDRGNVELFGQNIVPIYDPPHLLKGIRNNLLFKNLEINITKNTKTNERQLASWDIIELAYKMDINTNTLNRQLPRLTDEHVIKSKIKKMKVKCAAQIFSARLSAYIEYNSKIKGGFIDSQIGPLQIPNKAGYDTAIVLDFFNKVFDSVNAHTLRPETPLRVAVTENSKHHDFWPYAIKLLSNMRYVDPKTKQPVKCIPSLKNWIFTLRGFRKIWKIANNAGMQFLKTRNINQDPLENFFGMIRSHGRRNINPSCSQFCGSFKTLLINNLTSKQSMGSNCENKNDGDLLFTLKQFVTNVSHENNTEEIEEDYIQSHQIAHETIVHKSSHKNGQVYVAGWIAKKILSLKQFKNCPECKQNLLATDTTCEEYAEIAYKEYVQEKPSLIYPSMSFLKYAFIEADNILNQNISLLCFRRNVSALLQARLNDKLNLDFLKCNQHKIELKKAVIQKITRLYLFNFCKTINKILSGRDTRHLGTNMILTQAIELYKKKQSRYKKILKI
ncbi:uncharacterized protein LOC118648110 isoform X2 [Monomorium pharaonis]|uniref:uncharacterized protein LOC118644675 isoform X2 n=1 Tax=Monomorium pharaonis TaxID=307658 RepID=UPI001747CF7E|nr:uncharacterized protein LOC118644675 isoform X2 [Monomorium pharaonis]XP_036141184.1 uncharacterized protein LOC118645034 isoform X2 [Monomorium pharaonis]XP_036141199.1 uncharacterized protein LOC118645039 isoform X2 [Monomorium pharaonis]XP_036141490.1 uncharacterized protein LOC118645122 isoform X2 [Monomorium pharaonis]XP_036150244.1 uncharacterized protein LOC118648110 isoform X2 [Monomorium pharaonis]